MSFWGTKKSVLQIDELADKGQSALIASACFWVVFSNLNILLFFAIVFEVISAVAKFQAQVVKNGAADDQPAAFLHAP